jgi:hypothetical protein
VAGCCEGGNEPSGSIKSGDFPDTLRCDLLQEGSAPWDWLVGWLVGWLVSYNAKQHGDCAKCMLFP